MEIASITALVREVKKQRAAVIGVDGNPGVGKMTVAALLSRYLGYTCVHLDDYLDPGKGQFVDNLILHRSHRLSVFGPSLLRGSA